MKRPSELLNHDVLRYLRFYHRQTYHPTLCLCSLFLLLRVSYPCILTFLDLKWHMHSDNLSSLYLHRLLRALVLILLGLRLVPRAVSGSYERN
ncbi:hypothetical protein ASPTUDRAFT_45093 [Aspergillus tubingensis CBS 134.48]|uniref:Uncharacterized protein n=1 Tax=Aspergillus tubingensis (strain CBS 134.48) TaxID=767770 RepID=A0A1L9MXP1_ASPTC|nr:hypothetical protein ASPTUDRAFT_45093 [Aspergillus tubingensis CBS 134.48]